MAVVGRQQVLPTFVAVGIGVGLAAVGGGQQVARCVVGEGIGRGAVTGPGELAERIVGIGPGLAAGGFLGDIARGVVGKLAGQPVCPAENDGIAGNTGGGAGCSGGVGVRSARFAVAVRHAAQAAVRIVGIGPAPALGVGPGGHTAAAVVPEGHPGPVAVSFIKSIKIQLDRRNPA